MKVTVEELGDAISKLPPFETELPSSTNRVAMFLPDIMIISRDYNQPITVQQYRQIIFEKDYRNKCWTIEIKE